MLNLFQHLGFSQNAKIDSLLQVLKTAKEDTNKVNALNKISSSLYLAHPDSAILFAQQAAVLAEKINFRNGEANAYGNAGIGYRAKGDYMNALKNYFKSLKINESLNNKIEIARRLGNIGIVYGSQGDYSKALDYFLKALKLFEELGDKNRIATAFTSIGHVYKEQAASCESQAMRDSLFTKALDYLLRGLKIAEETGNANLVSGLLDNIGSIYKTREDYPQAFDYFFRALNMAEELGNKTNTAITLGNIGALYSKIGKFAEAEKYLKHSLALSDTLGDLEGIKVASQNLSQLYDTTSRYKLAFEYYQKYIAARDSIANDENTKKQTRMEMQYDFDKKQTADSIKNAEQAKQEEFKHNQEIQQQRTYTYGGVIGFLLMLIVAGVSFRAFRNKQKANLIIAQQKQLVEEKQKDILDSIHYAKRIQESLLPTEKYINKTLKRLNG